MSTVLLAGCQSVGTGEAGNGGDGRPDATVAVRADITVSPADEEKDPVDPGRTVEVTVVHGKLGSVRVRPDEGEGVEVTGVLGDGGRTWRSDRTMTPGTRYVVEATATNAAGATTRTESTFRTRDAERVNGVNVTPVDGAVVGAGQPVSIAFDEPVEDKAAVEKRLSVTTTPKVEGAWGWTRDPLTGVERVDWRPKEYWPKGTEVTLRAELSGVDTGGGRHLRRDVTTTFTTGVARISTVDLERHTMTVSEDGEVVRTIPISGGSPEYPTWNGTMVVLRKQAMVRMTSASVGIDDHYDLQVPWAVHMTTSGTYTHAAPWNEGKGYFGRVNTSHGCVGMSTTDGKWFYDRSVPGDIIEVTGSTRGTVAVGNGYGDWNLDFEDWRELGALR
ncbi:L,D-transpeptidase family protein [Streptomyces sp. TRM43335]|uniref:L,D-transpeptidase family protein n=1 Tax=Streptomyces taklimakanensis TaxID=2569853 RepID=A0A6G2BD83_9ACTN|nr:L,D-transpeptidase family protein [Streptomyces taklimakanensis]